MLFLNDFIMMYNVIISTTVFVCVCVCVFIPPPSSLGTPQLGGESRPSGWTHQPPAVCHLSCAQTHISSSLATSIHKRLCVCLCACVCVCVCVCVSICSDGYVIKSKSRSCSVKHEPSRQTQTQWPQCFGLSGSWAGFNPLV